MLKTLSFFISFTLILYSQEYDIVKEQIKKVYEVAQKQLEFPSKKGTFSLDSINEYKMIDSLSLYDALEKDRAVEYKRIKSNKGLYFKSSGYRNLNDALNFDPETGTFNRYNFRLSLELDIIKSGLLERQLKMASSILEKDLITLEKGFQSTINKLSNVKNGVLYGLLLEQKNHLKAFETFLEDYFEINNRLYFKKVLDKARLLEITRDLVTTQESIIKINEQLLKIEEQPEFNSRFVSFCYPFIEISSTVSDSGEIDTLDTSYFDRKKDLLAKQIALKHDWKNQLKLTAYTSHSWLGNTNNDINYQSLGFRLTLPIKHNFNKEKIASEIEIENHKIKLEKKEFLTHLNEHHYKLLDFNKIIKELWVKWLILQEKKRKTLILERFIDNNSFKMSLLLLEITNQEFLLMNELLKAKEFQYMSLLGLHPYKSFVIKQTSNPLKVNDQSDSFWVLIDKAFLNSYPLWSDFLINNNIVNVVLRGFSEFEFQDIVKKHDNLALKFYQFETPLFSQIKEKQQLKESEDFNQISPNLIYNLQLWIHFLKSYLE